MGSTVFRKLRSDSKVWRNYNKHWHRTVDKLDLNFHDTSKENCTSKVKVVYSNGLLINLFGQVFISYKHLTSRNIFIVNLHFDLLINCTTINMGKERLRIYTFWVPIYIRDFFILSLLGPRPCLIIKVAKMLSSSWTCCSFFNSNKENG